MIASAMILIPTGGPRLARGLPASGVAVSVNPLEYVDELRGEFQAGGTE
jgi:hypothetical protein